MDADKAQPASTAPAGTLGDDADPMELPPDSADERRSPTCGKTTAAETTSSNYWAAGSGSAGTVEGQPNVPTHAGSSGPPDLMRAMAVEQVPAICCGGRLCVGTVTVSL